MGNLPFEYIEVSSKRGENMSLLHERITSGALGHAYMGELIPKSYLLVEDEIIKMREEKKKKAKGVKELPIVDLRIEFVSRLGEMKENEVMRAIRLLHLWGSCVHFGGSEVLSKYLVVDPTFLTQGIMSSLFHPDIAKMIVNGLLPHRYLRDIWPGYVSKAEFLLALMEKFEVCFELGDRT